MPDHFWTDRACANVDMTKYEYDIFFPPKGKSAEPAQMICLGCPVRRPCSERADFLDVHDGVWGGELRK